MSDEAGTGRIFWLVLDAISYVTWLIYWSHRRKGHDSNFLTAVTYSSQSPPPPPPPSRTCPYACGLQCMYTICVMAMWVSMLVVASYLFIRKLWWICQISNQYICWKIFTIINVQLLNRQQMLLYSNRRRGQNDIVNFTLIIVELCGTFALNFDVESK